jgi:hypothetical protein
MSFYSEFLTEILQEKIAFFNNAGLGSEANLLQARLNSIESNPVENSEAVNELKITVENPIMKIARNNLRVKISSKKYSIPELEKQYILEKLSEAKNLKELEPLRVAYINRTLKINRANRSEKITPPPIASKDLNTGPYNNEKTFFEALQLIHLQDPLWIEDFKDLYFSIMPLSSAAAISKLSL